MATVPDLNTAAAEPVVETAAPKRRSTSKFKVVPEPKELRETIREACRQTVAQLDRSRPLSKDEMERVAYSILSAGDWTDGFLGWTMVALATEFYRDQVAAIPPSRRLFLMPHCLKHAEGCPADYNEFGLDCRKCGACSIADFRGTAEDLGYKVLVSEGTPIVLKIIVSGHVDAIVGVACLNVLEKAFDKILLAGIPCMAVPLLSSDCRNTSVDEDWVMEQIKLAHVTPQTTTASYLPLMRAAADLFKPESLNKLSPRLRGAASAAKGLAGVDPIAATEAIAYDFMAEGGKHMRPFGTLAVYDALTGGKGTLADGADHLAATGDAVRKTALAMEAFHKASLVHDDIQDDDAYRYGAETLHRKFGIPTAINVGDYLIGLGYRLLSRCKGEIGADATCELVDRLADAHLRLSEGQGAELVWRDATDKRLAPIDALKIYALKTSPAFEAALMSGVRLAGPTDAYRESIPNFCKHVGVAFQILNDLKDWKGDDDNKLGSAGDVIGGRPTVLWALALEALPEAQKQELLDIARAPEKTPDMVSRVRALYERARVFEKAARLVDKYQEKAEATADGIEPDELRRLLYYFIDTVLDRSSALPEEKPAPPTFTIGLKPVRA